MKTRGIIKLLQAGSPRFTLLLIATTHAIQETDWLIYLNFAIILFFLVLLVRQSVCMYKKGKDKFLRFIIGSTNDNIYDAVIATAGIMICYSMNNDMLYFWIVCLVFSIIEIIFPTKLQKKDSQREDNQTGTQPI